jgi:hypothetical protein
LGTKPPTISPCDDDFISYDFLKQMLPQPELFSSDKVLDIPKEDIEARHEHALCNKDRGLHVPSPIACLPILYY